MLVTAFFLALTAPGAAAHANLESSSPAADSQLDAPPTEVVLRFTERPDPDLTKIRVLDQDGRAVTRTEPTVEARSASLPLPRLDDGTFTVTWQATSTVDGHTTAGAFAFGVGEAPRPGAVASSRSSVDRTPSPSVVSVIGRATLYGGLALLVGAVVVTLALRRPAPPSLRGLAAASLASAGGALLVVGDQVDRSGASIGRFASSSTGSRAILLLVSVALVGAVLALHARRRDLTSLAALGAGALLAVLARVNAGHAAGSDPQWFAMATQWVHFGAVGAWLGGLPWFMGVLRASPPEEGVALARRFATVATIGLGTVTLTGVLRAFDDLDAWSQLPDTAFGQTLLVKVGLVAAIVGLGTANHFWLTRRITRLTALRRVARVEIAVAAGILVVTGVLTGFGPPGPVAAQASNQPAAGQLVLRGDDFAGTISATLTVSPGVVGRNRFSLAVFDQRGEPFKVRAASLRFSLRNRADVPRSSLDLERQRLGRFDASGSQLAIAGAWAVEAVIETGSRGLTVPFTVRPREPADHEHRRH